MKVKGVWLMCDGTADLSTANRITVRGGSGPAAAAAADGAITTITQFLSHLKVTSIQQHPTRRQAYFLASTLGKRHMRFEHVSIDSLI